MAPILPYEQYPANILTLDWRGDVELHSEGLELSTALFVACRVAHGPATGKFNSRLVPASSRCPL